MLNKKVRACYLMFVACVNLSFMCCAWRVFVCFPCGLLSMLNVCAVSFLRVEVSYAEGSSGILRVLWLISKRETYHSTLYLSQILSRNAPLRLKATSVVH